MSRTPLPYSAGDISALARSLRAQLADQPEPPSHLTWLNMLAKAAGFRNFQHLKAQAEAAPPILAAAPTADLAPAEPAAVAAAEIDLDRVLKVARCFGQNGILLRWPAKLQNQRLALWALWSRIASDTPMSEQQINQLLNAHHRFGDHALLRRELYDLRLLTRTPDGREYRRVERQPPPEALALFRHLKLRPAAA